MSNKISSSYVKSNVTKQTDLNSSFDELCDALSKVLDKEWINDESESDSNSLKYSTECFRLAEKQGVVSLLYPLKDCFESGVSTAIERKAQNCLFANIKLSYMARYLIKAFNQEGINVYLLKGASLAKCYPIAELRHFSDVDLFLPDSDQLNEAQKLLEKLDFAVDERQDSNHHIEYNHKNGLKLELHTSVTRAFESEKANQYIEEVFADVNGKCEKISLYNMEFVTLSEDLNAFYILLHILQHYLNKGFGMNLLCDYYEYWTVGIDDKAKAKYCEHIKKTGLADFSDTLAKIVYAYLGGDKENYPWINIFPSDIDAKTIREDDTIQMFIGEILDSGKFGGNNNSRLVNVKSDSFSGLVGQFHHQMKQNYPQASKVFLFWPVLWIMTFVIFVRNNGRIRRQSTLAVLKTAYSRGKLSKKLNLWDIDT